jgi:hypothetical protein
LDCLFLLPIIHLNKFYNNNAILPVSFKKIRICIIFAIFFLKDVIFVILLVPLRKISIIYYNIKVRFFFFGNSEISIIYAYNFNQNFIKTIDCDLYALAQYENQIDRECPTIACDLYALAQYKNQIDRECPTLVKIKMFWADFYTLNYTFKQFFL